MLTAITLATLFQNTLTKPVEIPFSIGDDAIIVDAEINKKKLSFMFDTGFSGYITVSQLVDLGPATGTMTLRDFVGQFQAKTVDVKSAVMNNFSIPLKDASAVQEPSGYKSESYGMHVDGIMGLSMFKNYVIEINCQNKKFVLHPDSLDITKRTPDNVNTFMARMLPMGSTSIELQVEAANGKKMNLALDTGNAFYATTHKDVLEEIGLWPAGKKVDFMRSAGVASGVVDSFYKEMTDLKIFGVPVKQSVWSIIDLPSSSSDHHGTVGFGFLRNFNMTIDLKRRRVWLEKISDPNRPPVADTGIMAAYDASKKRVRIFRIVPGSNAEQAGLKAGDDILSFDGADLGDTSYRKLQSMMEGAEGSTVKVVISRGGNLNRYELKRSILVNR